jgi:hypothetical protein
MYIIIVSSSIVIIVFTIVIIVITTTTTTTTSSLLLLAPPPDLPHLPSAIIVRQHPHGPHLGQLTNRVPFPRQFSAQQSVRNFGATIFAAGGTVFLAGCEFITLRPYGQPSFSVLAVGGQVR